MSKNENFYEWSQQPLPEKGKYLNKENNIKKEQEPKKESPKDMIKALKGIFCKGRYHSWIVSQETTPSKNPKKPRKNDE
jgi:anthranilate/para-aminobenzoate synthase component II